MNIRALFLHSLLVFSLNSAALPAFANDILYGITHDGILVRIDPATAMGVQVREQLPSSFGSLNSLEYYDGKFYAAYDFRSFIIDGIGQELRISDGGSIVEFGFTADDESDLGDFGTSHIRGLGARPSGELHASLADTSNPATSSGVLAEVDLSGGTYALVDGKPGDLGGLTHFGFIAATTFKDADTQYILSSFFDAPVTFLYMGKLSYASNEWDLDYENEMSFNNPTGSDGLPGHIDGMAFDTDTSDTLYVVGGWAPYPRLENEFDGPTDSVFYKVTDTGSTFSSDYIGEVEGFPGIMGLTYGPDDPCTDNSIPLFLALQNANVTTTKTEQAGVQIDAGNSVTDPPTGDYIVKSNGTLTLEAGTRIKLDAGFSVEEGGTLTAVIDREVCL